MSTGFEILKYQIEGKQFNQSSTARFAIHRMSINGAITPEEHSQLRELLTKVYNG